MIKKGSPFECSLINVGVPFKNPKIFKLIIETIKDLVLECNHVSLWLSSDFFDIYKCKKKWISNFSKD